MLSKSIKTSYAANILVIIHLVSSSLVAFVILYIYKKMCDIISIETWKFWFDRRDQINDTKFPLYFFLLSSQVYEVPFWNATTI